MAIYFDPFQQQAMQNQQSQGNTLMQILGSLAMQKISQKFKERELELEQAQHERLMTTKLLSSGDWTPADQYTPKEGEEKPPQITIGDQTLVRRQPTFVRTGLPGVIGYWSGGEFKLHDTKKDKSLQHVNTAHGVMVFDPASGQLTPAYDETGSRLMPYQAPRQASPYEGISEIPMYNEDTGETMIQWGRKGQPIVTDPNQPWKIGTPPKDKNTMSSDEAIAVASGIPLKSWRSGTITQEQANSFKRTKEDMMQKGLLPQLLRGGGISGMPAPTVPQPSTTAPSPFGLNPADAEKIRQLEELGIGVP